MGSGKQEYRPPQALADFLDKHPDAIYIGFGSLVVSNPEVAHCSAVASLLLYGAEQRRLSCSWSRLCSFC